jgi:aspartyl-tRNA synthetase
MSDTAQMSEHLKTDYRNHTCGSLRATDVGSEVNLAGWAANQRDHGDLIFVDLRDRFGVTQIAISRSELEEDAFKACESIRAEFVLRISGNVGKRKPGAENPDMPTGQVEVNASQVEILSPSKTPPFDVSEFCKAGEEQRLKYRYLDLRRPPLQRNMMIRHKAAAAARSYLNSLDFMEIETPMLAKSTPEGARDYLVPSRLYHGKFYALPQSPQLFKQLLMVAGYDRYYQIARCMRDEDLRADRQPEFTQIDIEMSFAGQEDVFAMTEGLMQTMFREAIGAEIPTPFPRLTHAEAMRRWGCDKPDLRFELELVDISALAVESDFKVFKSVVEKGGMVKALNAKGAATLSRKQIDGLGTTAGVYGAKGLAWIKINEGKLTSPIVKFFDEGLMEKIVEALDGQDGDLLLFVADVPAVTNAALNAVRNQLGRDLGLIKEGDFKFLWVTDFPLFGWSAEEKRWNSEHHPFTAPYWEDLDKLESDPGNIRSQSYDIILNGVEAGSGSVRIHDPRIQKRIFDALQLDPAEVQQRFGFFTDALEYGTPPHAGIAPGFDRLIAMMVGLDSIRDVIAFPKTQRAIDPMTGAPGDVDQKQMDELGISVDQDETEDPGQADGE